MFDIVGQTRDQPANGVPIEKRAEKPECERTPSYEDQCITLCRHFHGINLDETEKNWATR